MLDFLSYDPMVWIIVVLLGVLSSFICYFGVRAVCQNVYALQDFAESIAADRVPEDLDNWHFSSDEPWRGVKESGEGVPQQDTRRAGKEPTTSIR